MSFLPPQLHLVPRIQGTLLQSTKALIPTTDIYNWLAWPSPPPPSSPVFGIFEFGIGEFDPWRRTRKDVRHTDYEE